jgi:hypothetical protein
LITAISQQRTELSNSFLQTNRQQSFNVNSKTNYIQLKFTSATAKTNIKKLEFTGAPSNDSSCKLVPPKNKIPFQLTNDYTEPSSVVVVTQPISGSKDKSAVTIKFSDYFATCRFFSQKTKIDLVDATTGNQILKPDKVRYDPASETAVVDYCACNCYYKKPVYFRLTSVQPNR